MKTSGKAQKIESVLLHESVVGCNESGATQLTSTVPN
jgi:hypothetical protein